MLSATPLTPLRHASLPPLFCAYYLRHIDLIIAFTPPHAAMRYAMPLRHCAAYFHALPPCRHILFHFIISPPLSCRHADALMRAYVMATTLMLMLFCHTLTP